MRWGVIFLAWVMVAIYLADSCLDYLRVWLNPPAGYANEELLSYLTACGRRRSLELAAATIALAALYFGSGWAIARFRGDAQSGK